MTRCVCMWTHPPFWRTLSVHELLSPVSTAPLDPRTLSCSSWSHLSPLPSASTPSPSSEHRYKSKSKKILLCPLYIFEVLSLPPSTLDFCMPPWRSIHTESILYLSKVDFQNSEVEFERWRVVLKNKLQAIVETKVQRLNVLHCVGPERDGEKP